MKLLWFSLAIDDLQALREYIARDNPEAARDAASRILEAVSTLEKQPAIGRPGRVPGTRELIVSGTPYIIPYRARGNVVEILRVFHAARKWPMQF
ncbi:MAG: type II toxin-antitoxin system RelE/ParE family toxin [Nitrospirota bacterium]|jgi:addiction module RelE/StbE family toxin